MSKAITLGIIAGLEARPGTPAPELRPDLRPAIELRAWACAPAALKTVVAGDRRIIIDKKLVSLRAATEDQLVKVIAVYDREVVAAGFKAAKASFATLLASDARQAVALGAVTDPLTKDGIAFNATGSAVYWKGAPTDFAYPTISEPATTLVAEFNLAPGLLDGIDQTNMQLLADQTGTTVRALRTMNLSRDPKVLAELALRTINVVSVFKLEGERQATFAELKAMVEGLRIQSTGEKQLFQSVLEKYGVELTPAQTTQILSEIEGSGDKNPEAHDAIIKKTIGVQAGAVTHVFDPKGEQSKPPTDKDHMSDLVDDKKRAAVIIDVEPETDPLKVKPTLYTAKEVSLADLQKNVGKYALAQWCIDMDDAKKQAKWLELRRADYQPLPDHWVPPASEAAGEGVQEVKDEVNDGKRMAVKEIKTASSPQAIEKTDKIPDTTEQVQKLRTGQVQAGGASLKKVKAAGPVTVSFKAFPNTKGVQDDEVQAEVKPVDPKVCAILEAAGFEELVGPGSGSWTISRIDLAGAKAEFVAKAKEMGLTATESAEHTVVIEPTAVVASVKADKESLHSHGDEAHVNTHSHKDGDKPHTHDFVTGKTLPVTGPVSENDKHLVSRPAKEGERDLHAGIQGGPKKGWTQEDERDGYKLYIDWSRSKAGSGEFEEDLVSPVAIVEGNTKPTDKNIVMWINWDEYKTPSGRSMPWFESYGKDVSDPAEKQFHKGKVKASFDHIDLGDRSENPTPKSLGLEKGDKFWQVYGPETESDGIPVDIDNDVQDLSPVAAFETEAEAQAFFDTLPDGEYGGWVIEPETVGGEHAVAAAPTEKKKGKVEKKPKAETKAEPKKAGSELGKAMDEALGKEAGTFDREAKDAQVAEDATVGDAVAPKRPGPGESEMDESRTGHTEDFETRAKNELAKALGVSPDDLEAGKTYFPFDEYESVSFEGAGGEYTVFHEANADDIAKAAVRNDFEGPHAEGFDLFNQDFLMGHVDREALKGYMESVFDEWVRQDVGELSTSEKEEWLKANGHLVDKEDGEDHDEAEIEKAWSEHEEEWITEMVDGKLGNDGGESYWRENMGDEEFMKLVKSNGFFDIDGIVEEAVSADGPGHFMSSYDGELHEMGDGLAYVRTN